MWSVNCGKWVCESLLDRPLSQDGSPASAAWVAEMTIFRADLHVHTVLSPCADVEMIPPLIVQEALDHGINLIAITDHNASANIAAVQSAAQGSGLTVLPGMELQTREEVHTLCLFDTLSQVEALQSYVNAHLPPLQNRADFFGEQFVVDETGDFIRRETRLLLVSADITLNQAWEQVNQLGGLFIPAHIDRKSFGLLPVLGFVPPDLPIQALELSRHLSPADARQLYPFIASYPLFQSGDAHRLEEFLGSLELSLPDPSISAIARALQEQNRPSEPLG